MGLVQEDAVLGRIQVGLAIIASIEVVITVPVTVIIRAIVAGIMVIVNHLMGITGSSTDHMVLGLELRACLARASGIQNL